MRGSSEWNAPNIGVFSDTFTEECQSVDILPAEFRRSVGTVGLLLEFFFYFFKFLMFNFKNKLIQNLFLRSEPFNQPAKLA